MPGAPPDAFMLSQARSVRREGKVGAERKKDKLLCEFFIINIAFLEKEYYNIDSICIIFRGITVKMHINGVHIRVSSVEHCGKLTKKQNVYCAFE